MIECPTNHPSLPALFDLHIPNNPALWAVFNGRHAGRAFLDDLDHPSQCILRTDAVMTYASKDVNKEFLAEVINYLKQAVPIWLIRSQNDPPAPPCYRVLPRLEFYGYDPHSLILDDFHSRLPTGFDLRIIDRTLLERCLWQEDMAFFCGSLDNFLQNAFGICLMDGDEIIVESYTSAMGGEYAEIGAITHEPYRGKGYAPITVAHLIDALEQRGYHSYWSCDRDNLASARVARKLGFKIEKPYEIWGYKPGT